MKLTYEQLEAQAAVQRGALAELQSLLDSGDEFIECRSDEDCDHCYIIHEVINPALNNQAGQALLDRLVSMEAEIRILNGQSQDYETDNTRLRERVAKLEAVRDAFRIYSVMHPPWQGSSYDKLQEALAALDSEKEKL